MKACPMKSQFEEAINSEDVNIESFKLQDSLHPRFWNEADELDLHIRRALLVIAKDFIDSYSLNEYPITDIILTGSLANYNWDEDYSDIDLHIVMETSWIHKDPDVAKGLTDAMRNSWNKNHVDITVGGFPVEIYVQDAHEPHKSSGVYSLLDGKWLKHPSLDNFNENPNMHDVNAIVKAFMNIIDETCESLDRGNPIFLYKQCQMIMDKLKEVRSAGLSSSSLSAELSTGSIIFKTLRRNGYIEKLLTFKRKCFDLSRSLK